MPTRRRPARVLRLAGSHGAAETVPDLHYRLSFPELRQRIMEVELAIPSSVGAVELGMSRSSPGRYALHEFAKNVLQSAGERWTADEQLRSSARP